MREVKRRVLIFALTGLLVSGLATRADDEAVLPPSISTSACDSYPEVTCTSSDALACADALQLAADAREQLTPILRLGRSWRFPVHIHIMMPDDPLLAKINREASAVFADNTGMKIEAVLPSTDPDARAFIQRQYVTAMLWEKFFANTKTFDTHTQLDTVPVWLIEGLREWLNDDAEHDRESIVKRAVKIQHAPSLADVTGWKQLSTDRLMGLWQRSFCFYLVDSLIQPGARRDDFQQWLETLAGPHPTSAQLLFPTEMGWQRELVAATERSRDVVYTWDETVAELAQDEVIEVPTEKAADTHICTIETVSKYPRNPKLVEALRQKIFDLTNLELRAHPSWRPIIALYRFGLTALINDAKPDAAVKFIQQAHDLRAAEMDDHQKLVDYLNWYEVTKSNDGLSRFQSYFTTAQEMEKAQADPSHPNPIRAAVLQVESQL
jgi:hypothetical protein